MDSAAASTQPQTPEGPAAPPLHSPDLGSPVDEAPEDPAGIMEEQGGWRQTRLTRQLFL